MEQPDEGELFSPSCRPILSLPRFSTSPASNAGQSRSSSANRGSLLLLLQAPANRGPAMPIELAKRGAAAPSPSIPSSLLPSTAAHPAPVALAALPVLFSSLIACLAQQLSPLFTDRAKQQTASGGKIA